jgi:hypothetical protein
LFTTTASSGEAGKATTEFSSASLPESISATASLVRTIPSTKGSSYFTGAKIMVPELTSLSQGEENIRFGKAASEGSPESMSALFMTAVEVVNR